MMKSGKTRMGGNGGCVQGDPRWKRGAWWWWWCVCGVSVVCLTGRSTVQEGRRRRTQRMGERCVQGPMEEWNRDGGGLLFFLEQDETR